MGNVIKLPKVQTGISGLDEILDGGLPYGRTTVVHGPAGSGKTVFGTQFIYNGAVHGEPGLIVTFEERAVSFRQHALSLGCHPYA